MNEGLLIDWITLTYGAWIACFSFSHSEPSRGMDHALFWEDSRSRTSGTLFLHCSSFFPSSYPSPRIRTRSPYGHCLFLRCRLISHQEGNFRWENLQSLQVLMKFLPLHIDLSWRIDLSLSGESPPFSSYHHYDSSLLLKSSKVPTRLEKVGLETHFQMIS